MKAPISHLRWWMVGLLCLATQLNYLDRQTLSVLAPTIQAEFKLTDHDYSLVTATFLWTYAAAYLVGGRIVDWLGARRSFLLFASGWSLAEMLHAGARNLASLVFFCGLLALMEPANFPAGLKAISEWFPVRERALAVGIFNSGTALGNAVAMPVTAVITLAYGWRAAFVFTGGPGRFVGDSVGGHVSSPGGSSPSQSRRAGFDHGRTASRRWCPPAEGRIGCQRDPLLWCGGNGRVAAAGTRHAN